MRTSDFVTTLSNRLLGRIIKKPGASDLELQAVPHFSPHQHGGLNSTAHQFDIRSRVYVVGNSNSIGRLGEVIGWPSVRPMLSVSPGDDLLLLVT